VTFKKMFWWSFEVSQTETDELNILISQKSIFVLDRRQTFAKKKHSSQNFVV